MLPLRRCALLLTALLIASAAVAEQRSFNIIAQRFTFIITPSPFEVNLGDQVTFTIDASDDGTDGSGHGFAMQTYADTAPLELHPGNPQTIQFVAHTPGEFIAFCTRVCGIGHNSMQTIFTVHGPPAPTITDLAPTVAPTSGGTELTITGSGFAPGASVKIGDLDALNVEVVSTTQINAVTPTGPFDISNPLPVNLVVTNPDGTTAQQTFVWIVPDPAIETIAPTSGPRAGGTEVTITGVGFSTEVALDITFGGTPARTITILDAVTLTAVTPSHTPGVVDVAITTNKGSETRVRAFTFAGSTRRRAVRK